MCILKTSILLFVIIFAVLGVAKDASALTWNEALSAAEQNNNELRSARKQLESSEWSYRRSFSAFLPQLSASAGMSESLTATTSATAKSYSYGLSATQYLFKGMDNYYNLQSAYADYQYYNAGLKKTEADLYYELRLAFIDLFIVQENVKLLEEILERRKENTRLIELRYESGREDKGNLLRTKADQVESRYNLSSARRDLELAKLKLFQLLGQDVAKAEGEIKVETVEQPDFNILLKNSPSYIMAKYQLESAEIAQKSTVSGFLPSVSLSGNYRKSGGAWPPDSESSSWSLNVSYSLFPGGSNIADRIIYNLKLDKAREDFEKSRKDICYDLEEAHQGFKDALEALEVKKIYLEATEERAKIGQAKYLNGLVSYDEWDRIENEYITTQKSLLSYKKSAYMAEAAWHKSYGGYVQ